MKHNFFKSVLMIVLCLVFGTSAAHIIVVDNTQAGKNVGVKPNIDMTKYEKRTLANGMEAYVPKHDISSKKLNAGEANFVNVTFLLSYDSSKMFPNGYVTIQGENFSGDMDMEYEWQTGQYKLTCQLPAGTYDFIASGMIMSGGMAFNIKELVEVSNDMTITFDFAESNIMYGFKTIKPNGEEAVLNKRGVDENMQPVFIPGNTHYFTDIISPILKGSGPVGGLYNWGTLEVNGKNPAGTIMLNNVSNRYKLVSQRMLEDDDNTYIVKYESEDMSNTLLQNDPANYVLYEEDFTSIGDDNGEYYQGFNTIGMIDNVTYEGISNDPSLLISSPTTRVYVDVAKSTDDQLSKFDIMIQPIFQDNVMESETYTWIDYDWENNPTVIVDTMPMYRNIIGLPVLMGRDGSVEYVNTGHDACGNYAFHIPVGGGDIMEYPGHPQFSYLPEHKALELGSNSPICSVMAQNTTGYYAEGKYSYLAPCFIGRYGEIVTGYVTTDIRYNDELITDNCLTRDEDMYNFAAMGLPDGVITAHFETHNAVVDGLQGKNVTDVYYDQRQQDWTAPTMQMLLFKDREGNIIDRFTTADEGILEFAGGDFNYHKDASGYWFECSEQTVEVSYSPYDADEWASLEVNEVPGEFYMPGFGYFYRGSLQGVTGNSETGWYDLKIKLTDPSGNWQEQVISPAFRIGEGGYTGIETVNSDSGTEVARYTIEGRAISAPQAGVNIVKMSDGTVKKVLVK